MLKNIINSLLLLTISLTIRDISAGIRDHTRPQPVSGTRVSSTQAKDLTLTLVKAEPQNLQTWVRLAGIVNTSRQTLSAQICSKEARLIQLNQRVRAFPADSKSSIYRASISQLSWKNNCLDIIARLSSRPDQQTSHYVMEIIVQRGRLMAIPKEAIIEEGKQQIVYLQHHQGKFMARAIQTGLKGELYTQVLQGLNPGDKVVTFGSFFIDAEEKLKSLKTSSDSSDVSGSSHAHHHH